MSEAVSSIQAELIARRDPVYRDFQSKLMPTVDPETVIGVRTPVVRALPHRYYEENNLHGFLIETLRDYDACVTALDAFLPYVDNWATCDLMSPKVFKKHLPKLLEKIREWIASGHTYTVRFGLEMLMRFYLDGAFQPEYLALAADVRSEEYYVRMMIAWFFATALFKQYHAALPYIERCRLDEWTHRKAIQKAVESYRITAEQKAYLRSLK